MIAYAENIARRHMDAKRKAVFGLAWQEAEKMAAKERQAATQAKPGEGKVGGGNVATTEADTGKSRDKIGERVVSGKYSFTTFEEYCQVRWDWTSQRAHGLIRASDAAVKLETIVSSLPTRESHVRELLKLESDEHREAKH